MQKNERPVSKSERSESKYVDISRDVWVLFKKYLPTNADLTTFTDDVHALDQKYHEAGDLDAYRFMQKLLKVYFDELNELKGRRNGESET